MAVALGCTVTGACARQPPASPPAPVAAPAEACCSAEIAQFEAADRASPPPQGAVLFVGSSSVRLWPNLAADFPAVAVVQRGFGGSELDDVVHHAPRIVLPYRPRLIVLYAGDNDLASGKTPETVLQDYKAFVGVVRRELPETRIVFVSIKPSEARWALVDKMRAANALVRDYTTTDSQLYYVDTFTPMLGSDGLPRAELFLEDRLHMNAAGYALWRRLIEPIVAGAAP